MKTESPALVVPVIINAGAGGGHDEALGKRLAEHFSGAGMRANIIMAKGGAELEAATRKALASGARTIVAGGGDGTINAVASVVADSPAVLGVLPLGTLNHFAKDLGIPLELDEAVRNIAAGRIVRVDIGEVNGRVFINNSSIGIYPAIVRDRERQQRHNGRSKWLAFAWALLLSLRRYPFLHVRLKVNQTETTRKTPFVFIGNNNYRMSGFDIGTREHMNEGVLGVYVTQHCGRLRMVALALRALFGKLAQAHDFTMLSTPDIAIETRHARLAVATDGEVSVMHSPLRYRSRPGALRVLVPARGPGGASGKRGGNA
ncbi:MAG: sphingosine kinase [Herminiimonas sp.]|nr:sphingosine kinase [Herminiimonas sp.]MDB5855745.1 sphingosine kinase [Herminiimonas sp.]